MISLAILMIAALHPPGGLGVAICPSQIIVDIPCPGCGITRSVSCTVRGRFADAFAYNPFGLLVVAGSAFAMISCVFPIRWENRFRRRIGWTRATADRLLILLAIAFITFGVFRIAQRWAAGDSHGVSGGSMSACIG